MDVTSNLFGHVSNHKLKVTNYVSPGTHYLKDKCGAIAWLTDESLIFALDEEETTLTQFWALGLLDGEWSRIYSKEDYGGHYSKISSEDT